MRVLYIGGTGEISYDCIHQSVARGHEVHVFNRGGPRNQSLPPEVGFITGDIHDDAAYGKLAGEHFDAICQFRLFSVKEIARDIDLFTGHCGQYVFISSASAYQKPSPSSAPITEDRPLINPFAIYSRKKADCETMLCAQDKLPYTIMRPSLTYRTIMPLTALSRPLNASRLLRGKPVVVHGDGQSMWTVTHAEDFAPPFVGLLGNDRAIGEAFHLTHDDAWTWDELLMAAAAALGVEPRIVHVASDTLARYNPDWRDQLHGDKLPSATFDNSKIKSVVGDFTCGIDPWAGMKLVAKHHPIDPNDYDREEEALYERIIAEQEALGD